MEILKPFRYKPLPKSPGSLDKATLFLHQSSDLDSYTTNYFIMGERITFSVIYVRALLCSQSTQMTHNLPRTFQHLSFFMPPDELIRTSYQVHFQHLSSFLIAKWHIVINMMMAGVFTSSYISVVTVHGCEKHCSFCSWLGASHTPNCLV